MADIILPILTLERESNIFLFQSSINLRNWAGRIGPQSPVLPLGQLQDQPVFLVDGNSSSLVVQLFLKILFLLEFGLLPLCQAS